MQDNYMGIVYKHTNKINGKSYIGITTHPLAKRMKRGYKSVFARAIKKYGWENFDTEILENCDTHADLVNREVFWIKSLNTLLPSGYNATQGGDGTIGWKPNKYQLERLRNSHIGKKLSEEQKKKISIAGKGKRRTEEQRMNISRGLGTRVYQFSIDGKFIAEYHSGAEAARQNGITQGSIQKCTSKKMITANGYFWMESKDELAYFLNRYNAVPHDAKEIMCFSTDGKFIKKYESISIASRDTNVADSNITKCAKGKISRAGQFVWRYVDATI